VASEWINIWNDRKAAASVGSVNGGDETVPTVAVGGATMVNPGPRQVKGELARQVSVLDAD
jgi:mycoredoxin